jgi:hypothetical protein
MLQYISDAIREFEGTSEEVRVTVADSELAITRGDIEGALKKLRKVPPESPHYTKVWTAQRIATDIGRTMSCLSHASSPSPALTIRPEWRWPMCSSVTGRTRPPTSNAIWTSW